MFKFLYIYFPKNLRINSFTVILVLLMDLLSIIVLFKGLKEQSLQFLTKDEFFPKFYQEIYIHKNSKWNKNNIFYTLLDKNLYYKKFFVNSERHNICNQTDNFLLKIKNDYDAMGDINVLDSLSSDLNKTKNSELKMDLEEKIKLIIEKLKGNSIINNAINFINENQKNKNYLIDIDKYISISSLKKFGLDCLLLLPILFVLIFINHASNQKNNKLMLLITDNLIIISGIPFIYKFFIFIFNVVPVAVLKELYYKLKELHLITFWYYILFAVTVFFIYMLIRFSEKTSNLNDDEDEENSN